MTSPHSTLPIASQQPPPAATRPLELAALTAARAAITQALQHQVISWEQEAANAADRDEYRSAQQFKDWAFAADLCIHISAMAVGALILDTLDALAVVDDVRTVQLPDLLRPTA
jgi:hypothetical protein